MNDDYISYITDRVKDIFGKLTGDIYKDFFDFNN